MTILGWTISGSVLTIGILTGLAYAILAVGITLIYRSSRTINFAHGEIGAFGSALLAKMVLDWNVPYWLALPAVLVVGAALGAAVDLAVVRRLFRAPRLILLVATIGVSEVVFLFRVLLPHIDNATTYPSPLHKEFRVGNVILGSPQLMVIAFVPAVIVGLALFLNRTPFGIAIRASADNQDRAQLGGIPIKRVSTVVWAISGSMATYRNTSLPASATVCSVSASSAGEPVSAAAIPFASAIAVLAASATKTLPRLSSRGASTRVAAVWSAGRVGGGSGMALAQQAGSMGRCSSAHSDTWRSAGMSASPRAVSAYDTESGGPGSTVRVTRPAAVRSDSRSARTESLIPSVARDSSRKPAGPALRLPRTRPFQRLPRNSKARASAASPRAHCPATT
ncbi:MAG: hypothetical protein QOJ29_5502 [Thermoleophilaceae bacterium]|nr:hypothetical protein [Thermoleophilaceae bacterium]